jgi:hypothetical protein
MPVRRPLSSFYDVSFVISFSAVTTGRTAAKMSFERISSFSHALCPSLCHHALGPKSTVTLKSPFQDGGEAQSLAKSWPAPWTMQNQTQGNSPRREEFKGMVAAGPDPSFESAISGQHTINEQHIAKGHHTGATQQAS